VSRDILKKCAYCTYFKHYYHIDLLNRNVFVCLALVWKIRGLWGVLTNQRNRYGNKDGTFIRQYLDGETWKTNYTIFTPQAPDFPHKGDTVIMWDASV
jgi:hypothetical protein